jgi:hypothetical protein
VTRQIAKGFTLRGGGSKRTKAAGEKLAAAGLHKTWKCNQPPKNQSEQRKETPHCLTIDSLNTKLDRPLMRNVVAVDADVVHAALSLAAAHLRHSERSRD